jgi:hypothetical protein
MSIALVGTPVVGVGRSATMRVTLGAPAGAGGVQVAFQSPNTAVLTITGSPVTVPQGSTTADVTVNGIAQGSVNVTADATGYAQAIGNVTVTPNVLSTPANLNVVLGAVISLPITVGPNPAPPAGLTINVTSANSSIVEVQTPTVTIPGGQFSANATIRGVGPGSAAVTASHASYAPSSTTVAVSGVLNVIQTSVSFNNGFTPPFITVQLENGVGVATPAPAALPVTLVSANPNCVSVPATVTIQAGQVSAQFQPTYGGVTTPPCTAVVTASRTGLSSDTVSVTVNPQPGISNPGARTVGAWLELSLAASLDTGAHGGVTVTVTSDDPTRVRVAPDATTAGATSFTINLPNGTSGFNYWVQGIEGTTGTAHVTLSAPGFASRTHDVTVVPPVVEIMGLNDTTTSLSANDTDVYVQVGTPDAGGTRVQFTQNVRGGAPAFVVTLTNSTAAVAQLSSDQPATTGQVVTKPIAPGTYYTHALLAGTTYGLTFDPLAGGATTVTVTGPAGVATATTTGVRSVTVTGPGITMPNTLTVGQWLQLPTQANLGASGHGGVTATVTSSNPDRVRVAPNATTAGSASITVNVPNNTTAIPYVVSGIEGGNGSATITVTVPGFPTGTHTVNVVTSGVEVIGVPTTTTTLSANNTTMYAQVGLPNAGNTALLNVQNVRAGAPLFVVTLTNSNATVAQLYSDEPVTTGQTVTKPIDPGIYYTTAAQGGTSYGLAFDPIAAGTTTVTVSGPSGVLTMTTNGVHTVTVTGPGITMPPTLDVGAWLQRPAQATLGAGGHGGVTATITSSDPSRVRVSSGISTAGTASTTVNVPNNQTAIPYFVQGMEGTTGSATLTITTPGFPTGTHTVNVVQPGIEIIGIPATTTTLSVNDTNIYMQVGIPQAGGAFLSQTQNVRAGAAPIVATVTNSNAAVAQLYSDEPATTGQSVNKPIRNPLYYNENVLPGTSYGLAFDPIGVGSTTVTVSAPGFTTTTTGGVRTVGVTAPGITIVSNATIGAGLQRNLGATLGAGGHGGVSVTVTSSAPSLVRVSANELTAGTTSISVPVANLATSIPFFVQGMENVTGTAVVTLTAPGFLSETLTVTVVQPGVQLVSVPESIAAGAPNATTIYAEVGIPNSVNTAIAQLQDVRGGSPGFVVTLTNSNAAVARLYSDQPVTTGQVVTKPIQPGIYYTQSVITGTTYGLAFDPLAAGTTTVTVTGPPGVITMTTEGVQTVIVTP